MPAKIYGYGEDALTLWALTQRLPELLQEVKDTSAHTDVTAFFRPSFGRSGGASSAQFGEFDFVIATPAGLYLGETKWQNSPETAQSQILLRPEQQERHRVFAAYYQLWITQPQWPADTFLPKCAPYFAQQGISKPVAPPGSLLAANLHSILETLSIATGAAPQVTNLLLIVKTDALRPRINWVEPTNFRLVILDASQSVQNGFLPL